MEGRIESWMCEQYNLKIVVFVLVLSLEIVFGIAVVCWLSANFNSFLSHETYFPFLYFSQNLWPFLHIFRCIKIFLSWLLFSCNFFNVGLFMFPALRNVSWGRKNIKRNFMFVEFVVINSNAINVKSQ